MGCDDGGVTEVVIVVESDLAVPDEADAYDVTSIDGPFAPAPSPSFDLTKPIGAFPHELVFFPGAQGADFSVVVRLFRDVYHGTTPTLIASRTVTDVRFVAGRTMMLPLPIARACTCAGTSCPTAGDPQCDNLDRPALRPYVR